MGEAASFRHELHTESSGRRSLVMIARSIFSLYPEDYEEVRCD